MTWYVQTLQWECHWTFEQRFFLKWKGYEEKGIVKNTTHLDICLLLKPYKTAMDQKGKPRMCTASRCPVGQWCCRLWPQRVHGGWETRLFEAPKIRKCWRKILEDWYHSWCVTSVCIVHGEVTKERELWDSEEIGTLTRWYDLLSITRAGALHHCDQQRCRPDHHHYQGTN